MREKSRPFGRCGACAGFTLIELAIVLVIIGILAPVVYNSITSYVAHEKDELAKASMERARELILGRVLADGGTLPAADAGDLMPADMAVNEDPWQSRLGYWAAPELVGVNVGVPTATTMELRIYANVGNGGTFPDASATLDRTIPDIAYVLVSPGKNRVRETVVDTSSGIVVSILRGGGPLNDGAQGEFDDIVEYVSLRQLQGRYLSIK